QPRGDAAGESGVTFDTQVPGLNCVAVAAVAHPDVVHRPERGHEIDVDITARAGEADVDVLVVDEDPPVLSLGKVGELELEYRVVARKHRGIDAPLEVIEQEVEVEILL